MANSFDVKFNRKKPIFCPTFSFLVGPLFFHALELSYVNEKVIMNLKRKKKEKIILPVAHVRCQFTFKLLCMGSLICPSLFYARLSQSELCWSCKQHVRDDWNTTVVRSILFELQIQHSPHNFFLSFS